MAITEDPSTPAVTTGTGSGATLTTASFSPPAASLLVALVTGGWSNASTPVNTASISDSVGLTWTKAVTIAGTKSAFGGLATIWYSYLSSAPGAMTVTGTFGGYSTNGGGKTIAIRVLNGAASNQSGAATATSNITTASTVATLSITTTTTGSVVYAALDETSTSGTTFTPNGATTLIDNFNNTADGINQVEWKATSATGTPGATTLGGTWSATKVSCAAAFEVLPQTAVAEGGPGLIGLAATGTGTKVAPTGGRGALGFATTGVDRKVAPELARAAAGLAGTGVDTKVSTQAGASAAGVTSTSIEHRNAAQRGTSAAGVACTGTPHKSAPNITGTDALGLAGSCTAKKITAESGVGTTGLAGAGTASKRVAQVGATEVGLGATGADVKAAPQRGTAALGAATTAADHKTAISGGRCPIGLAVTELDSGNRAAGYLGLAGKASPVKVAVTGAVCTIGMAGAVLARKSAPMGGLGALALTGTGFELKFVRPWPPRALSVVLTYSDLADTDLTSGYQATVDLI